MCLYRKKHKEINKQKNAELSMSLKTINK